MGVTSAWSRRARRKTHDAHWIHYAIQHDDFLQLEKDGLLAESHLQFFFQESQEVVPLPAR